MKLWGSRFEKETSKLMEEFNNSLSFDIILYEYDITGSIAHVKMLAKQGILEKKEMEKIISGLKEVKNELTVEIKEEKIDVNEAEDIHSLVEKRLTEKIGDIAGKMHTARSRNDQVALDMRLFLREEVEEIKKLLKNMMKTLIDIAEKNREVIMPGYTHLQRAQPITFAHYLLAYYYKLKRDYERLEDNLKRINIMPLGSGALAGSSFPLDREWVASELGFEKPSFNSLDGVSDRDFIVEFLSVASNIMIHLSGFSEEIIMWNSAEFNFIELDDRYTTGSSIMPQKKNPDLAELVRGKTGSVFGSLFQLMTTLKGLPLAYNKDLQEDKKSLFETIDLLKMILKIYPEMINTMEIKKDEMEKAVSEGFLNATELANYFAKKDIPFREAHKMVGKAVLYAQKEDKELNDISISEWNEIFPDKKDLFTGELKNSLDIKKSLNAYDVLGGPAPKEVEKRIRDEKTIFLNDLIK